jgi:hypothetical protein
VPERHLGAPRTHTTRERRPVTNAANASTGKSSSERIVR